MTDSYSNPEYLGPTLISGGRELDYDIDKVLPQPAPIRSFPSSAFVFRLALMLGALALVQFALLTAADAAEAAQARRWLIVAWNIAMIPGLAWSAVLLGRAAWTAGDVAA